MSHSSYNIPLSLYIHIPWCTKKCPYCDFNSHTHKSDSDEKKYIETLLSDLRFDLQRFKQSINSRSLNTIFIGGGTPSLFSAESFDHLLTQLQQEIDFSKNIEITLEANPGSSEAKKFKAFRQAGINRLSIGIQSFNTAHLQALGRIHNSNEAEQAAGFARQAGFDNFNLDLMFGLPQQNLAESIDDINSVIEQQPSHISCYQLTIEPNTLFHHQPPITPDDDLIWDMQTALQSVLVDNGYQQYEVSAYAKANRQCQHNLNYWQFGDYLGIGAGAHSKITGSNMQIQRIWKIKHPEKYLSTKTAGLTGEIKAIAQTELALEFMMNALRLTQGFELKLFEQRTGLHLDVIQQILDKHQQQGLITLEEGRLAPTIKGTQFINSMLADYM